MTDQEHAKSIFLDALDHADGDRSRFIEARCEGDLKLAQRVLKLLATHDEADSVFHHGEMDTQSSPLNVSFDDAVSSGSTLDLEPGATSAPVRACPGATPQTCAAPEKNQTDAHRVRAS